MTSCIQVTSLELRCSHYQPQQVLLPTGSSIQLQHLSISSEDCSGRFQQLQNLQDATRLTFIELIDTYPDNLDQGVWPASMPHLRTIRASAVLGLPPQQLLEYHKLRHLDMTCCLASNDKSLPTWCSQLTQLYTLRLNCVFGLNQFPVCLLHLRQLSSLDLSCNGLSRTDLPAEIVQFSKFTAVTSLDLTDRGQYSLAARQQLKELSGLMRPGVVRY